jgi:kumamolisin
LGGRVGFINPQIYALAASSGAFNDIVVGNNRCTYKTFHNVGYDARPGWDACSGLGSPNGAALCRLLKPVPSSSAAVAVTRKARKAVAKRRAKGIV